MTTQTHSPTVLEIILRAVWFCILIFFFLVAVKLFGDAAKLLTVTYEDGWNFFLSNLSNPFLSLSLGIFLTAIMQSSSATTSIAVAMTASGTLTVEQAVPFVMGTNIGTSVTSTIVALGCLSDRRTFSKAYSASALQDSFNLMTTAILFPLEICFGFLSHLAHFMIGFMPLGTEISSKGSWNPLPWLVNLPVEFIHKSVCENLLCLLPTVTAALMMILGLGILFFSLIHITRNMKVLMADNIEKLLNRVLSKNGLIGIVIGIIVTMIIQSSSITTSLLVPLVASGVLKLEGIYPILLGANIGTTITAILAAMAYAGTGGAAGLTLGLVHFLFNFCGTLIFYPIPWMRWPVRWAKFLSKLAERSRYYIVGWVLLVFIIIPLVGMLIFH
ncbi:MAG: Na/Pi symporter [Thermoguttaceae bacterium]|nr:Na/Pi symporter [Thermoguttaceae bacterium]